MARSLNQSAAETVYHGEVWTDARGYATVRLPDDAGPLGPLVELELRDLDLQSRARVTAELKDGRFTIVTDEPHVKVAWRVSGRWPASHQPHPQQEGTR